MIGRDVTLLNSIRDFVSNSMQNQISIAAQLSEMGAASIDMNNFQNIRKSYIKCGESVCGTDENPPNQCVKRS